MSFDALLIADSGVDSVSGTSPLKLKLGGKNATIQVVQNFLENRGHIRFPIENDGTMSWSSSPGYNGIYLLSYLKKKKLQVELIDNYSNERDSFLKLLQQTPRTIIISTTFIYHKNALRELIEDIRSFAPNVFIIVGGPFVYFSYLMFQRCNEKNFDTTSAKNDFLFLDINNEPNADLYIISPRGERLLCEVINRIKLNRSIDDIPNSAQLKEGNYFFTKHTDNISDEEELLVDWESLPDTVFKSGVIPMQASNGCPYHCAFCNFTKDRRFAFIKPVDRLITELKTVSSRGARYVWFVDDNFRLGRGDLNAVCRRLVDEDISIRWMSFIRASSLIDVDTELLRQAGCIEVQLGLESADPQILHNMNKKSSPKMYAKVIKKLLASGINCSCYFIFGFPGETNETAYRTRKFIKDMEYPELDGILTWSIFPFLLAPMSPIYEYKLRNKYGLKGYMQNWKHQTMGSDQAMEQVKKTFLELENSGAIYRDDNLELLGQLTPQQRKKFVACRQILSKSAMKEPTKDHIIFESFSKVLAE